MDKEEKRIKHNESSRKYRKKHPERIKESQKKYYLNNLEKVREAQRSWQKRNRKWIREYTIERKRKQKIELMKLLGNKCSNEKCGIVATFENFCIFDFHHLDPKTKEKHDDCNVYMTKAFLKLVLDGKIQLLCANCHRELHWKEKLMFQKRLIILEEFNNGDERPQRLNRKNPFNLGEEEDEE